MARGISIKFRARTPPPPVNEDMELNTIIDFTFAGAWFPPSGPPYFSSSGATMATGGYTWISLVDHTITGLTAISSGAADDNNQNVHIWINGADTGTFLNIPNGQMSNTITGLSLSIPAGQELCLQIDPLADGSTAYATVTIAMTTP